MATTPQLPNPATAKSPTTTLNGVTYYLRTGAGATPTWLRVGTGNKLYPVDLTGKQVAGKPAVFNTEAEWAKSVNTAIQPKPTAASVGGTIGGTSLTPAQQAAGVAGIKTPAPVAPTPAPTTATKPTATAGVEQYGGVTPPSRLALPDPTTALSKIISNASDAPPTMKTDSVTGTSFYLSPPTGSTPAMWVAVPKGSTVASNGQPLQALQRAQTDYINPKQTTPAEAQAQARQAVIDQQQAAAQQPVAPVAPTGATKGVAQTQPTAPAPAPTPVTPAVPMLTGTALIQKQTEFTSRLRDAQTQDEFDTIVSQAAAAGAPLNPGIVDSFQKGLAGKASEAERLKQQNLVSQYDPLLRGAQTQAEFDKAVADFKAAGGDTTKFNIDPYQQMLTRSLVNQEQQRIQTAQNQYRDQLAFVNTQEGLDKIKADAAKANVPLTDDMLARANQAIVNRNQFFDQVATAVKDIPLPQRGQDITSIGGMNIMGIPDDPITGAKGGFYVNTGSGFQKLDSSGRPTGSVVPFDQYNELLRTTNSNVAQYQAEQSAATKAREMSEAITKFEAALPQPGSERWNYLLTNRYPITGPDGRIYEPVDQSLASGAPAKWIVSTSTRPQTAIGPNETYTELGKPDQVFTKGDVNQIFTQNAEIRDAQAKAERAAMIARQQAEANDFGPFDDILYATLAIVAIGAIAGAAGASLGSLGGTAGAEASALAGEAATTAGTMAQGGATASEIAGVLEGTYGMSGGAASQLASTASGAVSGAIPAETLVSTLASSSVTPEMIAIANATLDPIAALTAQAGWTTVDMAYLASIGMPASVMAAAASTNAALGAPTTVAEWAAATGGETVAGGAGAGASGGPVAPGAAVDTSQMIPAYDAAGNVGYMDPATGNFYSESGQLISEGTGGFSGSGTQYAGVDSGVVTDVGAGSAGGGPGETFTQIFDDGSQLITDAAGNPIGGIDSAGNAFSVNPETGAGFYPETGLPTAGAGGGGGGAGGAGAGAEAGTTTTAPVEPTAPGTPSTTPPPTGETTVQVFDDGSKLVLDSNGNVVSGVDSIGNTFTVDPTTGQGIYDATGTALSNPSNVPIIDKSVPYVPGKEPTLTEALGQLASGVKEALPTIGVTDVLAGIGAANVLGPLLVPQPPTVQQPSYGPLPPLTYGTVGKVNLPGLNPGAILPVPADYQTTSPVQSKFYYGPRPYQAGTTFDPTLYAQVNKPAQPYGLQQAFFETPQSYDQYQFRPYGPDLTRVEPLATTYQPIAPVVPQTQG